MIERTVGPARARFTGRAEGDMRDPARQPAVLDRRWSRVEQVHGARVVVVDRPGDGGGEADALVTAHPRAALSVRTADCAPIALASAEGVVAAVHAGWRGLVAGVVGEAVAAMRGLGADDVVAVLGPCIRPGCYEFAADDLDAVAAALGDGVRGTTSGGAPALDLPAGVRAAVEAAGAALVEDTGACTACDPAWYSHRARAEPERQALVVWLP